MQGFKFVASWAGQTAHCSAWLETNSFPLRKFINAGKLLDYVEGKKTIEIYKTWTTFNLNNEESFFCLNFLG